MNWQELTSQIQDESVPLSTRRVLLQSISSATDGQHLAILAQGCLMKNLEIAHDCRDAIRHLSRDQFHRLLDVLLGNSRGRFGKRFVQLMHELRGAEMMRYILRTRATQSPETKTSHRLVDRLREAGLLSHYLRTIVTFPPEVAKTALMALARLDSGVVVDLANLTTSLPPDLQLKALQLFDALNPESKAAMLILRKLTGDPSPEVRAQTAYLVGQTLQNVRFLTHLLKDPIPNVRFSALASIEAASTPPSAKVVGLLYAALDDVDGRVRAKAARILYLNHDRHGLGCLISMLSAPLPLQRAYAAHYLGELKEISVRDQLQVLAQGDADPTVRTLSQNALKRLRGQVELFNQQFDQLDGLLARHRLLCEDGTGLLWRCLQDLDPAALAELIPALGFALETVAQLVGFVQDVGLSGTALPWLLGTLTDEAGRVTPQIADLNHVRIQLADVIKQLQPDGGDVARRLFENLTTTQQKTVRTMFLRALEGGDAPIQALAAQKLAEFGVHAGRRKLMKMASDSSRRPRLQAAEALSTIAEPFALEYLKRLADDPDPEIKHLAQTGSVAVASLLARDSVSGVQLKIRHLSTAQFPTVQLQVAVTDPKSQPITDLEVRDFTLLEADRRPMKPTQIRHMPPNQAPVAVSLVMDSSASLTTQDIRDVASAVGVFLSKLHPTDRAAIVKFAQQVEVTCELTPDMEKLIRAIETEYSASTQGTALYDSILAAIAQLRLVTDGIKGVIVTTDGEDTASDTTAMDVISLAKQREVKVYTISLGTEADTEQLGRIAQRTHGKSYTAPNCGVLPDIYQTIVRRIYTEYQLVYDSHFQKLADHPGNVDIYVEYGKHNAKATAVFPVAPAGDERS